VSSGLVLQSFNLFIASQAEAAAKRKYPLP
jgi:hypothetical protein